MLYILHGPDQFRAQEALREIRSSLDSDGNLGQNTVRLDGKNITPSDLQSACQTASFFAETRLVIVEKLQERLRGSRRRGRRTGSDSGSDVDSFADILVTLPASTAVILLDDQPADGLMAAIEKGATVKLFPILRANEVRRWASNRVKDLDADFAPGALERLLSMIDGAHLGELANEIDKLTTYANGRAVEAEDVDRLVSAAVQMQTWDLTDAVIEGRGDRALVVLQAMDAKDHPRQLLIFMITRQYRQLILAQALLREGMSSEQIGAQIGLRSAYPLQKVVEQASRYPADRLEAAYRRLFETDVAVKTGVMDVDTALEMLILELVDLGRPSRGGRGQPDYRGSASRSPSSAGR